MSGVRERLGKLFKNPLERDNPSDTSKYAYKALSTYGTYNDEYGYDVLYEDDLVEKIARDDKGYIHLGYVKETC